MARPMRSMGSRLRLSSIVWRTSRVGAFSQSSWKGWVRSSWYVIDEGPRSPGPGRPGWLPTQVPHRSGLAHHAHPVPHLMNSRPARSVVGTWTWFRSRCTCQVSLQRLMRRHPLPLTGFLGLVPPLPRYYEVLRLPAAHFAVASFPSLGDTIVASVVRPPRPRTRSRGSLGSW